MQDSIALEIKRELSRIYAPIRQELETVEKNLITGIKPTEVVVHAPFEQLQRMKGKLLRPAVLLLIARELGEITGKHLDAAQCVELVHFASLIHDDVVDHAGIRRGVETINRKFGYEKALLTGDYVLSKGMLLLEGLESSQAFVLVAKVVSEASLGEISYMDFSLSHYPSEREYIAYVDRKTAGFFVLAAQLGAIISNVDPDRVSLLGEFGLNFGRAFQIIDDCSDLFNDNFSEGKPVGNDISQESVTLPVIKLFDQEDSSWKQEFTRLLKVAPHRASAELRQRLLKKNVHLFCLDVAVSYMNKAMAALAQAGITNGSLPTLGGLFVKKLEYMAGITSK